LPLWWERTCGEFACNADYRSNAWRRLPELASGEALRLEKFPTESVSKVEAACRFVEVTGNLAAIGPLSEAALLLEGKAGTIVTPGGESPPPRLR